MLSNGCLVAICVMFVVVVLTGLILDGLNGLVDLGCPDVGVDIQLVFNCYLIATRFGFKLRAGPVWIKRPVRHAVTGGIAPEACYGLLCIPRVYKVWLTRFSGRQTFVRYLNAIRLLCLCVARCVLVWARVVFAI